MMPFFYALAATFLLSVAGSLFINLDEDPDIFIVLATVVAVPGLYLLLAGGVARGIEMARRD